MVNESDGSAGRGDNTREALIAASIGIFSRNGFHAASTRAIAEAANVNQALIAYHFGGKQGLYEAVFAHITQQVLQHLGPIADRIEAVLGDAPDPPMDVARRRELYLPPLLQLTNGMVTLIARDESAPWVELILREQTTPGPSFDMLYDGFIGRLLGLLSRLVERLRGHDGEKPGSDARLLVATILGQIQVFRAARAAVMRLMDWTEIGVAELEVIQERLRCNLLEQLSQPEVHR